MKRINLVLNTNGDASSKTCQSIVRKAGDFVSDLRIIVDRCDIDLKSILGLMSLCLYNGREITLEANGEDEVEALQTIAAMLN